jgi:CTP synthase
MCDLLTVKCGKPNSPRFLEWKKFVSNVHNSKEEVRIAVIGKYFETGDFVLSDAYLSVIEAVKYSAYALKKKPVLVWFNALDFEKDPKKVKELAKYDGILVPGGFGARGIEGKLNVIKYAREHKIPYFGLCYGMQLLVIEFARNVAGLKGAHTREVDPKSPFLVIDVMESQKDIIDGKNKKYGGTMRVGAYPCVLKDGTHARDAYKEGKISERHRHRYEVNQNYVKDLEEKGLVFSGVSPDKTLMEIAELPKGVHPFMLGVQFHPEFKARPLEPHPLFTAFIKASLKNKGK